MTSTHLPTTLEELSAEWATTVLRDSGALGSGRVCTLDASPVGEQGQTSEVVRLTLSYDESADGAPRTLIAKLPSRSAQVRAVQRMLGSYAREVCFYRDVGDDAGISVPRCFGAALDEGRGDFLLLLEDMSGCRVGDIWTSSVSDVTQATEAIAGMHARWWCNPTLRHFTWLPQHDDPPFHRMLGNAYRGALPVAVNQYSDHFTGYVRELALSLAERWDAWVGHREGAPFTLVHNDFHPKQLFFPGAEGGRFAVFDWQSVVAGRPTFDLARLMLKGLTPKDLREHKDGLLRRYHAVLTEAGVVISLDQVMAEWRSSLLHTLAFTVFALATTDVQELERAASVRGVDYRRRLIDDLAESLADDEVHLALEKP